MKIIIGSASDRKINVVKKVVGVLFGKNVECSGYPAKSGQPETPWDKQTFDGARNRALDAMRNVAGADYYVGLESGLVERYGHIYEEAWAIVIDKNNVEHNGYSSGLKVPDFILNKMDEMKMEHSDIMTIIEKEYGKLPNDTWGTYSGGVIQREISLEEALRNAIIQITSPETGFYKK